MRDNDAEHENLPRNWSKPSVPSLGSALQQPRQNCIALQNEDHEEDAIVITALDIVPFCCHADLITMNRDQLVQVANTLNTKLPLAMQIDTSILRTESFIRKSIELLVGIRSAGVPPQTPTTNRSLSLSLSQLQPNPEASVSSVVPFSPGLPMPLRNRSNISASEFGGSPGLASLLEEDEETQPEDSARPKKRRRTIHASPTASPTPPRRYLLRSQSQRVAPLHIKSPEFSQKGRVSRSRSERLPFPRQASVHRNITITRGRGRDKFDCAIMTSTPKPAPRRSAPAKTSRAQPEAESSISISSVSTVSSSSSGSLSSTPRVSRLAAWFNPNGNQENPSITGEANYLLESTSVNTEDARGSGSDMEISHSL